MARILPIDTPTLGDRSYLVHDGRVAFVVDPQRDIDRVLDLAAAEGVRITHVFETHIHNDYVTGGHALAAATGAAYHVNADDPVTFDRVAGARRRRHRGGRGDAGTGARHPGPHVHPPVLRPRRATGGRLACSPAGRCCTGRSAGPTCSAPPTPMPSCTTSTPPRTDWPPNCPTRRVSTRRTASAASAPPPRARPAPPPWPRRSSSTPR